MRDSLYEDTLNITGIDVSVPDWGAKSCARIDAEFKAPDNVNHPKHYTNGNIEVIDYIKDNLSEDAYEGYCIGNVIKYVSRYKLKNGKEDLEKAFTYLRWAIEGKKVGK